MSFSSIDDLTAMVVGHWNVNDSESGDTKNSIPPEDVIGALLRNCFFASLKREEGRPTEFDLALCSPSVVTGSAFRFSRYTHVFTLKRFEQSRQLTVSELVRLAPACNPDKTVLLAHWDFEKRALFLWGIADLGWEPQMEDLRLSQLRIRVFSPGEMRITVRSKTLCTFKDGRIIRPAAGLINRGPIYEFFKPVSIDFAREVVQATRPADPALPIAERDERAFAYLRVIQELAQRLQRLKHGGCFLVISEPDIAHALQHLTIKYRCQDSTIWKQLVGKWILHYQRYGMASAARSGDVDAESQLREVESGLRDSVEALARFSAVDGAVLITRKFDLIGFGCVVQLHQHPDYRVFSCADRLGTQIREIVTDDYGTRHRSAFEFCYRCPPSVAIVGSSDGGTKFVTRRDADVYFWDNTSFDAFSEQEPYDIQRSDYSA